MNQRYRLLEEHDVREFRAAGRLYEHVKSGARVFTLKNDDKNKVFAIGFRTTPADSTGVAHIMEHSVLCGSKKYPLKDPFVELAKGSLNTFLNAMTFPDKTLYPIASVNDKDFMNLMDVYLDSVFHPNVYIEPKIFKQEGWHYELEGLGTDEEELKINGVVYNEMKGAFSNPDSVLERYTAKTLFPDTTYVNESGGLPSDIPTLSYEKFLDFHRTYYHPSNSYIYLYGDMDMESKLNWLDENYLNEFDRIEVDSHIDAQRPFDEPREASFSYAVGINEPEERKSYLSENFVLDGEDTLIDNIAWQLLEAVLLGSPGAELREALIKAGIGEDVYGGCCMELKQPYFSVIAKNTDISKLDEFKRVIHDKLEEIVRNGLNKKSLKAELNFLDFKLREEDYGSIPAGLAICINLFGTWLYDGSPFTYLLYNDAIKELKRLIDTDFFEQKIKKCLLDNKFRATVNIVPEKGLTDKEDKALAARLKAMKDTMSENEKAGMARETEELKSYQAEADTPETLSKLPVLKVSDIDRQARTVNYSREGRVIYSNADTRGIAYMRLMFDTDGLTEDELQFAAFLADCLGELDTKSHKYSDLYDEVLLKTGGITFDMESFTERPQAGGKERHKGVFYTAIRSLDDKIPEGIKLATEILKDTVIDNPERLSELLFEVKSRQQSKIDGSSHTTAVTRAASYFSEGARFDDLTGGIAYMDFVSAASSLSKEPVHMKRFIKSLTEVRDKLIDSMRLSISLYGSDAARCIFKNEYDGIVRAFKPETQDTYSAAARTGAGNEGSLGTAGAGSDERTGLSGRIVMPDDGRRLHPISGLNEGIRTSSQVNYVARCGSFKDNGLPYTGALKVLRVMLNYDYLWINLRVLGGAYGCMSGFGRSGRSYLVSYRDPEIEKTNRIFEALPEYLESWDGDETAVRKYIIGAISSMDRPQNDSDKAGIAVHDCIYSMTCEELQRERNELLDCTSSDIRELSRYVRAMLDEGAICTIGNETKINSAKDMFKSIRDLL